MPLIDFPAHVRLMLLASQADPEGTALPAFLTQHAAKLDWVAFLAVTFSQRLGPRVLAGLRNDPAALTASVLEALQARDNRNRLHVMDTLSEAQRLLAGFARLNLQLRVLKGYSLSQSLYGSPTARHCGDLDLLTEDRDLAVQVACMQGLGYRIFEPDVPLNEARLRIYRRHWKGIAFRHERTGMMVDLHWRLFNNPLHAGNQLSGRPGGLSREDEFLYTCLHGVADGWVYGKSLCDVAEFVRQFSQTELDSALCRAAGLGVLAQVSSAVHLAGDWFGTRCSSPHLLPAEDSLHRALRTRVEQRLIRHEYRAHRIPETALAAFRNELKLVPGTRSARKILLRYLWRPRVWTWFALPDRLLWLHPVLGALLPPRARLFQRVPAAL